MIELYEKLGWIIIPIKPNTKQPFLPGWQKATKTNISYFKEHDCNVGLLLGNIIDVEADNKHGNDILERKLKDAPPHPTYQSAKSIHHLFQNSNHLPYYTTQGIEFRSYKHCSTLPPSVVNGVEYKWLVDCSTPLPEVPSDLLGFYNYCKNIKIQRYETPKCFSCEKNKYREKACFERESIAFRHLNLRWICVKCRTKKLQRHIKELCRQAKKGKMPC